MWLALAINHRTATKAAIKRASAKARREMHRLDARARAALDRIYREARADIEATIRAHAGGDGSLRLEVMQDLLAQVNARLSRLADLRDTLFDDEILYASALGVKPFEGAIASGSLTRLADDAARWVNSFVANDGLQLSDRIWRLNRQARDGVGHAIESAVIQGHSASRAAQDFLSRGVAVPKDVADKMAAANASSIARVAGQELMGATGSPYDNALRLFRTEINRAHGEAYMAGGEAHPDFAGWRFLLSPNHPQADICDMHARANLYGLGPGVYPSREKCPWPAHPNTLSFVEIVFKDEITEEDRAGKADRLQWLTGQPTHMQAAVLGSTQKAAALRAGVLKERQIATPWRVLKERYRKQGIDIDAFKARRIKARTISGTQVFGMDQDEFRAYTTEAVAHAPAVVHDVVTKVVPPASIRVIPSGTSYFSGNGIVLARTSMRPRSGFHSAHDVYRHEYGHYVDFWAMSDGKRVGRVISSTHDADGGLFDTIAAARRSLDARSAVGKARRVRMRAELLSMQDTNLADLFGALTKNKIGWGHSAGYLSRPGFAETEVFANLFDLYARKDRTAWNYVNQELPDLAARFVTLLEGIAR